MTSQNIPVVDLGDWHAGGAARQRFIKMVGESLADIGFFAVRNHGVSDALMTKSYDVARTFFHPDRINLTVLGRLNGHAITREELAC